MLATVKTLLEGSEQAERLLAEIGLLSEWAAGQPWGRVDSLRRRGLVEADARPVVELLHSGGYRVEHFITFAQMSGITIAADRDNIAGLLISLVRKMPAFARGYSAENRALRRFDGSTGKRSE